MNAQPSNSERLVRQTTQTLRFVRQGTGTLLAGADGLDYHNANATRSQGNAGAAESVEDGSDLEGQGRLLGQQSSQGSVQRQQSQAQMREGQTQDQVREQLQREVWAMVQEPANIRIFFVVAFFCFLCLLSLATMWLRAAWAALAHFSDKCDQPLQWYLLTAVMCGQVSRMVQQHYAEAGTTARGCITALTVVSGWAVIGWGIYMICVAESCAKDSPYLFYPTQQYIITQVIISPLFAIVMIATTIMFRPLLLRLSQLVKGQGCRKTVEQLPTVEIGSQELTAEDGEVVACSICIVPLDDKDDPPVRTPCNHFFHRDCLKKWCENHMTCPMCRKEIGAPDRESDVDESSTAD